MNRNNRPLAVTILGAVYIAIGTVGFVYHGSEILRRRALAYDDIWIEVTELLAVLCGGFILRGQNWARWLAVAWMAFHVVLSAFQSFAPFAVHCLFCAVIAWILFRADAACYFSAPGADPI